MFKSLTSVLAMITVILLTVVGSLWGLWFIAFGNATVRDVNPFAAAALLGLYTLVVVMFTHGIDLLSDMAASRAAVKGNQENVKQMRETLRALAAQGSALSAQARAERAVRGNQSQGGIASQDDMMFIEGEL